MIRTVLQIHPKSAECKGYNQRTWNLIVGPFKRKKEGVSAPQNVRFHVSWWGMHFQVLSTLGFADWPPSSDDRAAPSGLNRAIWVLKMTFG